MKNGNRIKISVLQDILHELNIKLAYTNESTTSWRDIYKVVNQEVDEIA